jgi:hypothetical protein
MDSNGRVFLPYPPDCFAAVLDLLHVLCWWPPSIMDGGAGDPSSQAATAATVAAAQSAAAPPPPPPLTWWRDRVSPSREPILRQLIIELGLQDLVHELGMGAAGRMAAGASLSAAADASASHPQSTGSLYARLAALGR